MPTSKHIVYPHALTACASAIESALKARPGLSELRKPFQQLLSQARLEFPELALFTTTQLDDFRNLRNRIIHAGFHARDDSVAASAPLLTGLPFLKSASDSIR